MARGWESKSVEQQIDLAADRHGADIPPPSAEQLALERKRDSVMLQRKRITGQLDACSEERYRTTLAGGLAFLDSQLAEINHLLSNSIK